MTAYISVKSNIDFTQFSRLQDIKSVKRACFCELQNTFCTQHACGFCRVSFHPGLHLHCQNTQQLPSDSKLFFSFSPFQF